MTHLKELPPRDFLQACFDYDPKTGSLKWKKNRPVEHFAKPHLARRSSSRWGGTEAGKRVVQTNNGKPSGIRLNVYWNGKSRAYYAHRIIFAIMGVDVPTGKVIDHRDSNPYNNRWENLRLCTHQQNIFNSCKRRPGAKEFIGPLLPRGVCYNRGSQTFIVEINVLREGKRCRRKLGSFTDVNKAAEAYKKAAQELHGEFAHF